MTKRKQYLKWSCRPTFKREKNRNGAIAIENEKCRVNLDKPIYIGISILDLIKVLIGDFHYSHIKNRYGGEAEISLTSIDSLVFKIEVESFSENFYRDNDLFDFSYYPKVSKYYNDANNLLVDKIKNETCSIPIKGFVRLKSEIYTFITR